jgi:hypothetical protein
LHSPSTELLVSVMRWSNIFSWPTARSDCWRSATITSGRKS